MIPRSMKWGPVILLCVMPAWTAYGQTPAAEPYTQTLEPHGITFEFVPIPGGTFQMGSPETDPHRQDDEMPQVQVQIEPFWMMKYEITWEQFRVFMNQYELFPEEQAMTPPGEVVAADAVSYPTPLYDAAFIFSKGDDPRMPAVSMTPFAAKQFARWLSLQTGHFYRLPTEAEWEYACRAGSDTAYHFGDDADELDDYAWYFDNSYNEAIEDEGPRPVGGKQPNAFGLYDMHGNVAEIVLDQHVADHYGKLANPVHVLDAIAWPSEDYPHVLRGGSYLDDPENLRSAKRAVTHPNLKRRDPQIPRSVWWFTDGTHIGFRLVRPMNVPSPEEQQRYWEPHTPEMQQVLEVQRSGGL